MKSIQTIAVIVIISSCSLFAGGPWPQPKGYGYFKLSEWWSIFDQHYTDAGLIDPNVTTGIFNTTLYAEYGLTDHWTLVANAPLFSRSYMNNLVSRTTGEVLIPGEAINGIGDIDLGIKYGFDLFDSTLPVALSAYFGLPTGESAGGSQKNLQTGDGEFNQMIQLDLGKGFNINSTPAYVSGYVGLNNRSKGYSEELRWGIEAGVGLFGEKVWITSRLNIVESFKNGETAETVTSTSIFANNTEYTALGIEANVYLTKNWGISAGMTGALRGEIIAAAPSYSIGVFYDLK